MEHAGHFDESGNGSLSIYDFYVNIDNIYLNTEIKQSRDSETESLRAQFIYGLVIFGLALIKQNAESSKNGHHRRRVNGSSEEEGSWDIEKTVALFSDAAASVLLPVIHSLAELEFDKV